MDADSHTSGWLLLLAQLPGKPSSARVALWRHLRAAGATTMVNGAWMLPETTPHADLFEQLRESIIQRGGTAFVLSIPVSSPEVNETIMRRFQADRSREYDEFAERCTALLDEISKETKARKYTFAEMEENEQDVEKLARWLAKIEARDFFPDERRQQSAAMMARCRSAMEAFSHAVYATEGVQEITDDGARATDADSDPVTAPALGGATRQLRESSGAQFRDPVAQTPGTSTQSSPYERRTADRDRTARTPRP
jgi:hypothetical protein